MLGLFAYVALALLFGWVHGRFFPDADRFIEKGWSVGRSYMTLESKTVFFYFGAAFMPVVLIFWVVVFIARLICVQWAPLVWPFRAINNLVKRIVQWP